MSLIPGMIASARESCQRHIDNIPVTADAKVMFRDLSFDDLFEDAGMVDLIIYLRGNKHLKISDQWRAYLPTKLEKYVIYRPIN